MWMIFIKVIRSSICWETLLFHVIRVHEAHILCKIVLSKLKIYIVANCYNTPCTVSELYFPFIFYPGNQLITPWKCCILYVSVVRCSRLGIIKSSWDCHLSSAAVNGCTELSSCTRTTEYFLRFTALSNRVKVKVPDFCMLLHQMMVHHRWFLICCSRRSFCSPFRHCLTTFKYVRSY